jgi:hypothetical protein
MEIAGYLADKEGTKTTVRIYYFVKLTQELSALILSTEIICAGSGFECGSECSQCCRGVVSLQ